MNIPQAIIGLSQQLTYIIIGIIGLGFLIGFHELGHFLFCKLFKIRTPSFSIGMGPKIFSKKIGETEFALSAIPLGGYVEIAGMTEVGQGDQKEASRADEYSFAAKPYYQKLLVLSGGILFNLILGYALLTTLFYMGMPASPLVYPTYATTAINTVGAEGAGQKAGLKPGDKIISIDNQPVHSATELINFIKSHPEYTTSLVVERDNTTKELSVTIEEKKVNDTSFGYMDIELQIPRYSFIDSAKYGLAATGELVHQVWLSLKSIFTECKFKQVGGPLMVLSETIKGAGKGIKIFLLLLAFISVNLALLNIIPLPILDGGQALFYTIEALIGKPLPERIREYIHYVTWFAILALVIYLSIKDVIHIFCIK